MPHVSTRAHPERRGHQRTRAPPSSPSAYTPAAPPERERSGTTPRPATTSRLLLARSLSFSLPSLSPS
eukprot:scaffold76796_cov32-Tisochrysis_lutea.AAC.1